MTIDGCHEGYVIVPKPHGVGFGGYTGNVMWFEGPSVADVVRQIDEALEEA